VNTSLPAISRPRGKGPFDPLRAASYLARMAIRPILFLPDKQLRRVSEPVAKIDKRVRALVEDMFETMYDAPGVGLAAIQIGVPERIVTIDATRGDDEKNPVALINPEIVWESEETVSHEEGCLSIPEYLDQVIRPDRVRVRFLDLEGREQEVEADGLLARVVQHEVDHINGVLFIDHLSKLKRDRVVKKYTKAAKRIAAE
jgi:peptide deformylase